MMPEIRAAAWIVLVVDDEPDSIEVASEVLKYHGATVHRATDGEMALRMLETLRPTFILTDLSMPIMDGWELLSHVRKNPNLSGLPVVALTAHSLPGDAERGLGVGFNAYLTKPLSAFTLINDIIELLPALA